MKDPTPVNLMEVSFLRWRRDSWYTRVGPAKAVSIEEAVPV